ncbi:MAG: hypothetical protein VKL39_03870 [Leptolyngbyaceae bacterium]|nr:hypothetical protein [Leptolyngbyaceae bacterium]
MDELSPILKELTAHPVAFLGGLASGFLRLNLTDDPVKTWLEKRSGEPIVSSSDANSSGHSGNGSGPHSISIE